jgi:hypothetical protein
MEKKAVDNRSDAYDRKAKQFSKQAGIDYNVARTYIDPDFSGEQSQPKAQVNEVKRKDPKTGKTAIFDGNTKQFLRYE